MELLSTELDGVIIVRPTIRHDARGSVRLCGKRDGGRRFDVKAARDVLLETVGEYRPTADLVDLVWRGRQASGHEPTPPRDSDGKVTSLRTRRGTSGTT